MKQTLCWALLVLAVASCSNHTTRHEPASSATPPPPAPSEVLSAVSASAESPSPSAPLSSPPSIGASTVRVFLGDAPDDGPAYVLSRGPIGRDGCSVVEGSRSGFRVGLARGEFRGEPPYQFELRPNQDEIEASACDGGACVSLKTGTVEVTELEIGRGAKGVIDLEGEGQSLRLSFDAVWCGPLDRPPWTVRRSSK